MFLSQSVAQSYWHERIPVSGDVTKQQPKSRDQRTTVPLLRLADQASVAVPVALLLASMSVYWFTQGGHRGALIEIDRAQPLQAQFQVELNSAPWSAQPTL